MTLVAGVDSSTQSCKVVVVDADTGQVVRQGRAPHPDGTEVDPRHWWEALQAASRDLLGGVEAISVGGQQHGMVTIDEGGGVVRPALLWNDSRSAAAARDLVVEGGGRRAWAEATGSVPLASFTVTKLRWLAQHEPELAAKVTQVMLPHDWLTWRLRGGGPGTGAGVETTTDRGDASGTGYWSAAQGAYREDLLELAFGRSLSVPRVAGPAEMVGETASGTAVAAGTGDNMAAALGVGAGPGDLVVSLGTSGVVAAVSDTATTDATGTVAGFADATGRHLPLVCTLNAARVLTAAAAMLGTDLAGLDELALRAPAGAGGLVMLPYLDGERTPELPDATGTLLGLTRASMSPQNVARAAVEGMLCGLADGVDALRAQGVDVRRALLVGGAGASRAVQAVAPAVLAVPVVVPPPGEYVALGAARQAAWALRGTTSPPPWGSAGGARWEPDGGSGPLVRDRYAQMRNFLY